MCVCVSVRTIELQQLKLQSSKLLLTGIVHYNPSVWIQPVLNRRQNDTMLLIYWIHVYQYSMPYELSGLMACVKIACMKSFVPRCWQSYYASPALLSFCSAGNQEISKLDRLLLQPDVFTYIAELFDVAGQSIFKTVLSNSHHVLRIVS